MSRHGRNLTDARFNSPRDRSTSVSRLSLPIFWAGRRIISSAHSRQTAIAVENINRFKGKTILVTGAASGIGRATAEAFAKEGGMVVVTDINAEGLEKAFVGLQREGYSVETHVQDVTDRESWTTIVKRIVDRHGGLDVLFNNAGGGHFAPIEETTLDQWRYVNSLNLDSVFSGCRLPSG